MKKEELRKSSEVGQIFYVVLCPVYPAMRSSWEGVGVAILKHGPPLMRSSKH